MSLLANSVLLTRLWYGLLFRLHLAIGPRRIIDLRNLRRNWLVTRLPALLILTIVAVQGFTVQALVKAVLIFTVYIVASNVLIALASRRTALYFAATFTVIVSAVLILRPVGPYDEIVPAAKFIDEPQTFRTRIHTFPDSPKWAKIRAVGATPYLFVSSPTQFVDDMAVISINGELLGPIQTLPGSLFGSGAWSVPISWGVVENRETVEILLHLAPGPKGGYWLAGAADVPISGRKAQQSVKYGDGPWRPISDVMRRNQTLTVEIRFVDNRRRVLGILY